MPDEGLSALHNAAASHDGAAKAYSYHSQTGHIDTKAYHPEDDEDHRKHIDYEWTEEFVSVKVALQLAGMPEALKLKHGDLTYKEILRIFVRRARNITDVAERDKAIVELRRAGATLKEAGSVFSVTRERARQIVNAA